MEYAFHKCFISELGELDISKHASQVLRPALPLLPHKQWTLFLQVSTLSWAPALQT